MRLLIALIALILLPGISGASDSGKCEFDEAGNVEGVLIGWNTDVRKTTFSLDGVLTTTEVGPFRPLALIAGSSIEETKGSWIYEGQSFWPALFPDSEPVRLSSVGIFLDRMGVDHCVYHGTIEINDLPRWTLLSSEPTKDIFQTPAPEESEKFYELNTTCVYQGNLPETCTKPKILAISDINGNGLKEFWATEPFIWDTGLTVWEYSDKLIPLLRVCVGCSD